MNGNSKGPSVTSNGHTAATSSSSQRKRTDPTRSEADDERRLHPLLRTHRNEVVRLMLQTMRSLGYNDSAKALEAESGVRLQTHTVSEFREAVLGGAWDVAHKLLTDLDVASERDRHAVCHVLLRQQYLELLEQRNAVEALTLLRSKISPIAADHADVQRLAGHLMCNSNTDLYKRAAWDGAAGTSRQQLLSTLNEHISTHVLMREDRLAVLLEQAQTWQTNQCRYHNAHSSQCSLLSDHTCGITSIPQRNGLVLTDHHDEVWYVTFSPCGKYLATCSKDTLCFVYNVEGITASPASSPKFERIARCAGHTRPIMYCAFQPVLSSDKNSRRLLTASSDGTIALWSVTGDLERRFIGHIDEVNAVAWLPCGTAFVSASEDRFVYRWDVATGAILQRWHGYRVYDLAVTPNGTQVVAVDSRRRLLCYSLLFTGDFVQGCHDQAVDDDDDDIVVPGAPHAHHLPRVFRYSTENYTSLALSRAERNGSLLCLANVSQKEDASGIIVLYDMNTEPPCSSSATTTAALQQQQDELDSSDLLPPPPPPHAISPGSVDDHILQVFHGPKQSKYVIRSCFGGPTDNFVASGSETGEVLVFHRDSGQVLFTLRGHEATTSTVAWNPVQLGLVASGSDDRTVRLWFPAEDV